MAGPGAGAGFASTCFSSTTSFVLLFFNSASISGANVNSKLSPGEEFVKIVKDELTELLGGDSVPLETTKNPTITMLVGLQGSGKTTTIGKLANFLRKNHKKKPLLVACDIYRPAAIDQLKTIGKELNIKVYSEGKKDPVEITKNAINYAKENDFDYILIDTAGRLQIDDKLMEELQNIENAINPHETLLVIDAMMGQDAINVINGFNDKLKLTGVILTKLDGDTRGGVALSVRHLTNIPIKFIGVSEKMDGLSEFHPDRMAKRILGMGDVVSIIETASKLKAEEIEEEEAERMARGNLTLNDFLLMKQQVNKMGGIQKLVSALPGGDKAMREGQVNEHALDDMTVIISSMTKREREHREILN